MNVTKFIVLITKHAMYMILLISLKLCNTTGGSKNKNDLNDVIQS